MDVNVCLAIVLGCLSVASAQNSFCSGDLCFIRPDPNSGKTWMDAQQTCKENNSILPIANGTNSRMSFINALNHFQLNGMDVWLGATASDVGPTNWRWLDGSEYSGPDVQGRGEYSKSYAYVAKTSNGVLAYAFPPSASYSYICQCKPTSTDICTNGTGRSAFVKESQCFMRYDEQLPWFNARNKCLSNSCDLASVSQLSILDGMVDSNSSGFWVGLRTSQWNWQNAVTGSSFDVTFTSWRIGQPNDGTPNCMATDMSDFPNWKDIGCATQSYSYICQVSDIGSSSAPFSSSATTTTSASSSSTTTSTTTTNSPLGTPGTGTVGTDTIRQMSTTPEHSVLVSRNENNTNSTNAGSVNVALAIGLAVGLGVPFIILIVVAIVVVAVVLRRKRRNSTVSRKAQSTKKFVTNTSEENADYGTTEASENKKKGRTQPDDSLDQYATVKSAYADAEFDSPADPVTVYADLRFNPDEP